MLHFGQPNEQMPRLGVVVAKKLLKQAVRRNTVKRVVRECFRLHREQLPNRDLIVRLMSKFHGVPKQALATELSQLFARLSRQVQRKPDGGQT